MVLGNKAGKGLANDQAHIQGQTGIGAYGPAWAVKDYNVVGIAEHEVTGQHIGDHAFQVAHVNVLADGHQPLGALGVAPAHLARVHVDGDGGAGLDGVDPDHPSEGRVPVDGREVGAHAAQSRGERDAVARSGDRVGRRLLRVGACDPGGTAASISSHR